MTGLRIPPHNFIAVNSVKWNPLALLSCVTHTNSYLFLFLVMDIFKQIIHPARENTLGYSLWVSQVLFGLCPGETQTSQDWRWATSSICSLVNLNQDFAGVAYILSVLVGHHALFLPSTEHCAIPAVPSWNNILHGENSQPPRTVQTRKTVKTENCIEQLLFLYSIYVFIDVKLRSTKHNDVMCKAFKKKKKSE